MFYQKFWDTVGPDVITYVKRAFEKGEVEEGSNQVLITLIPKQKVPEKITQFRPIALCNVLIKIITKVIANRLKGLLPKLVSENQCSFVPKRQGIDNVVILQEVIHTLRNKRGRKGYIIVKLDLEKAYDRLEWGFLRTILQKIGFDEKMLSLIMSCLQTTSLTVLWNGDGVEEFKPTRGLRQGDPLAPYLFVLSMEILSQAINNSVAEGDWHPIKVTRGGPDISHLMFADDLILMGEATYKQAETMQRILEEFCSWSGQKISGEKSRVFFSQNTDSTKQQQLSDKFGIQTTKDLGKYLGIPILHGRVTRNTFQPIVDKVRNKLSTWKIKTMSRMARLVLIQSVTSTIPFYYMQTVKLPAGIIREIEKLNRDFLWGDTQDKRQHHPISWKVICSPKDEGGLGLKQLNLVNQALMVKLGWRMVMEKHTLWARTLWAKYGSPFTNTQTKQNTSFIWRSMKHAMEILTEVFRRQLAQSGYHGAGSAKDFSMHDVYDMQRNITPPRTENNKIKWNRIWKIKGPQSNNWLLWQTRHNRLPTKDLMYRRKMADSPTCEVCHRAPETILHVLRDCGRVSRMWRMLTPSEEWQNFTQETEPTKWIDNNINPSRKNRNKRRSWTFTFREGIRAAWFWRNHTTHQTDISDLYTSTYAMVQQIQRKVREMERMTEMERDKEGIG